MILINMYTIRQHFLSYEVRYSFQFGFPPNLLDELLVNTLKIVLLKFLEFEFARFISNIT